MKLALRSLNSKNTPKTIDEVKSFISRIDDDKFGLGIPPVTLADVMSYQDDPNMKDFDFFETYYNSSAATSNRKRSEELFNEIYDLDDDEKDVIDKIAFKTAKQIAKSLEPQLLKVSAKAKIEHDESKSKKISDAKTLSDNINKKSKIAKKSKE
jgi:hypothetical protein